MNPRPTRRPLYVLVAGLLLIGGLLLVRPRLQHAIMVRTALNEPSVEVGLVEELVARDRDPLGIIERFYRTGKIPHRLAAMRALSRSSLLGRLNPVPDWLHEAALDADFQVRELALGVAGFLDRADAGPLVRASLLDVDPELKHVAIRAAVASGLTNLITDVVQLLDEDSLNVRIAAASALRQWTGQDFGVRRSMLGGEYNDLASQQTGVAPETLERVETGLKQWKRWWTENERQWANFNPPPAAQPGPGERLAPDFELDDLAGQRVRLSELRGRPVFINFWATWCTACWSELPELVKLHERYGDRLAILGISLDGLPDQHELDHGHKAGDHGDHDHADEPTQADQHTPREELIELVADFAMKKGLTYRILLDPEGVTSLVYQGNELPVNVLIDAEGRLRRRFIGPRSPAAFDAMIVELGLQSEVEPVGRVR